MITTWDQLTQDDVYFQLIHKPWINWSTRSNDEQEQLSFRLSDFPSDSPAEKSMETDSLTEHPFEIFMGRGREAQNEQTSRHTLSSFSLLKTEYAPIN